MKPENENPQISLKLCTVLIIINFSKILQFHHKKCLKSRFFELLKVRQKIEKEIKVALPNRGRTLIKAALKTWYRNKDRGMYWKKKGILKTILCISSVYTL